MRSIKDYAWTAFFALAVAFGAWLSWAATKHRVQTAETAAATAQTESKGLRTQVEAYRAADAVREAQRRRVRTNTKENHDRLDKELAVAPAWADADVPAGVADGLRDAARKANVRAP